jgi:hypothetical protein
MSDQSQPTEEQLRALQEQLEQLRVEDLLIQTIVSVINLGARKGADGDKEQLRLAIESARALLVHVEAELGDDAKAIRDAISQLQIEYAKPAAGPAAAEDEAGPAQDQTGPAQSSGRLWVPGQ